RYAEAPGARLAGRRRLVRMAHGAPPGVAASGLLQEFGPQHQALHLLGAAFDQGGIVGQADVPDQRSALDRLRRALDLEVLDQRDGIAVRQFGAVAVLGVRHVSSPACRRVARGAACLWSWMLV